MTRYHTKSNQKILIMLLLIYKASSNCKKEIRIGRSPDINRNVNLGKCRLKNFSYNIFSFFKLFLNSCHNCIMRHRNTRRRFLIQRNTECLKFRPFHNWKGETSYNNKIKKSLINNLLINWLLKNLFLNILCFTSLKKSLIEFIHIISCNCCLCIIWGFWLFNSMLLL